MEYDYYYFNFELVNEYDLKYLVVNKTKYTKYQAISIAKRELCFSEEFDNDNTSVLTIDSGYLEYILGDIYFSYYSNGKDCPCWILQVNGIGDSHIGTEEIPLIELIEKECSKPNNEEKYDKSNKRITIETMNDFAEMIKKSIKHVDTHIDSLNAKGYSGFKGHSSDLRNALKTIYVQTVYYIDHMEGKDDEK